MPPRSCIWSALAVVLCLLGVLAPAGAGAAVAPSGARDGALAFGSKNDSGEDCPVGRDEGVFEPCTFTIYRVGPTGRGQKRLSDCGTPAVPDCDDIDPAWSPTGRRIAFVRNGQLAIMHADGTRKRSLGVDGAEPAWSPDGRKLVFRNTQGPFGISTIKTDGTGLKVLTRSIGHSQPTWSARGTIAFTRFFDGQDAIWTMSSTGTRQKPLFKSCNRCDHPDYSPDGRYIAFSVGGGGTIDVATSAGTRRHRLNRSGGSEPAWSPSGRSIAYSRDGEIYVARRDGTKAHRVAYDSKHRVGDDITGEYGSPSWQPLPR